MQPYCPFVMDKLKKNFTIFQIKMHSLSQQTILTVSQLTKNIKTTLEGRYRFVKVRGEISNMRTPSSGHSYFTLKDNNSQIRAVLFKQQKRFITTDLRDGQQVICFGRVTVYEPRGDYQLILDSIEPEGKGQLQQKFEDLKKELHAKGYFDSEIKKNLPFFPKKIAVITSPTGAAIQDFLKIVRNRQAAVTIQIFPVRVQGNLAAGEIAHALNTLNRQNVHDLILLCRGGGSIEDLWAFNEVAVAEAVYASKIPVVSAVGHEIDFTIADFCADHRSPTPTAAAEELLPDTVFLRQRIDELSRKLELIIKNITRFSEQKLTHNIRLLGKVNTVLKETEFRLSLAESSLFGGIERHIISRKQRLSRATDIFYSLSPQRKINDQQRHLAHLKKMLQIFISRIVDQKETAFQSNAAILHSVSPLATLERGYSIAKKITAGGKAEKIITDSAHVTPGDDIQILLHRGQITCEVKECAEKI